MMDEERIDEAVDESKAGDARDDEERVRAVIEELRRLKVEDLALDMAVSLVTVGYQKLGLTEQTRELRDLSGARLSIELLRALLDVLEREGAALKLDDLRSTLAAMQMNYARAVAADAEAGGEPAGEGAAELVREGGAEPVDEGDAEAAGEGGAGPAAGGPEPPA